MREAPLVTMRALLLLLPLLAAAAARSSETREDEDAMASANESNNNGVKEANLTKDQVEIVITKKDVELSPGKETGANGEVSDEDEANLPENYEVQAVGRNLSPGQETGANGEGSDEEINAQPESLDVVLAKRGDTLVDGYVFKQYVMASPPVVKKKASGDFNIGDLVDLSSLQQQLPGTLSADPNEAKIATDLPGQALNPEDFHQADFVKEVPLDSDEDPILSAGLWEVGSTPPSLVCFHICYMYLKLIR